VYPSTTEPAIYAGREVTTLLHYFAILIDLMNSRFPELPLRNIQHPNMYITPVIFHMICFALLYNSLTAGDIQVDTTSNGVPTAPLWLRPYKLANLNARGIPPLLEGVRTPEQWLAKSEEIRAVWLDYLGGLPARPAPAVRVVSEKRLDDHIRRKIVYDTVYGDTVPALLLLPLDAGANSLKKPAVLALHPTNPDGKTSIATPDGHHNRMYALELVRRGYVVLAPDAMTSGERIFPGHSHFDSSPFEAQHPNWSTVGKNLTDHLQAMDVLCAQPEVDAERVGVIGHSFGAYNAYFLSSVDERVKAVVSSCGVCPFTRTQDLPHWGKRDYPYTHFPRISEDTARGVVPFEFNEIIALTAPRPQFYYAAQADRYFQNWREVGDVFEDVSKLYTFLGKPENFVSYIGVGEHDFPLEVRLMAYNFLDQILRR